MTVEVLGQCALLPGLGDGTTFIGVRQVVSNLLKKIVFIPKDDAFLFGNKVVSQFRLIVA